MKHLNIKSTVKPDLKLSFNDWAKHIANQSRKTFEKQQFTWRVKDIYNVK